MPSQGVRAAAVITAPLPARLGQQHLNLGAQVLGGLQAQQSPMCCPQPEGTHQAGWWDPVQHTEPLAWPGELEGPARSQCQESAAPEGWSWSSGRAPWPRAAGQAVPGMGPEQVLQRCPPGTALG